MANYEFGKRYQADHDEARREMFKFLQKATKLNDNDKVKFDQKLESLYNALTERDINYSDIDNARILLETQKITSDNIFPFLCDFDSDGRITGADEDKKLLQKNRMDSGVVMGNQMLSMMEANADIKIVN
ncbi:MAG: hypothetical protein GXP45_03695 [bacterium]|nr:hypothetical protein [bacterium]